MTTPSLSAQDAYRIRLWLLICAGMVFIMIVLGGATRLTESGLSMVQWQPLTILPPLNEAEWTAEFENYMQYPEYQKVNSWMTVEDFKGIYWLEYAHRLWGRLIGVVFTLPFLWFVATGRTRGRFAWTLGGLLILGGAQGFLGWFMVASGLVDRPDVSQYRLAAHLVLAFIVYGLLIWVALGVKSANDPPPDEPDPQPVAARLALGAALAILLVVVSGAFVAGLNAGLIYNTFPLMDGQIIPDGLYDLTPWHLNWFENIMTVQFNHRVLGITLVVLIGATWWRIRSGTASDHVKSLANAFAAMAVVQAGLGIGTLLLVVPLWLALLHQTGALILFTLSVTIAQLVHTPKSHNCVSKSQAVGAA
ncbi:MAG: COX15/CtaA family protein [Rhodospirillaceae bacterium]|nr:COX15/CtaA family protein [Rhodospirillaceae bacterium]